jgi:hypothetical protein
MSSTNEPLPPPQKEPWVLEIEKLLERLHVEDTPPITELRDCAKRILYANGMMYPLRLKSRFVGVHPRNRFGDPISPARVHELLSNIFNAGWSEEELSVPYAGDLPPAGTAEHMEMLDENDRLMEESNGMLPPYAEGALRIVSTTCSHTSQTHRVLDLEGASQHPKLSEDGRLRMDLLEKCSAPYAAAVQTGLEWNVVKWNAQCAVPGIMDLFQEAGNITHSAKTASTRENIMYKMLQSAKRLRNKTPDMTAETLWSRVLTGRVAASRSSSTS